MCKNEREVGNCNHRVQELLNFNGIGDRLVKIKDFFEINDTSMQTTKFDMIEK